MTNKVYPRGTVFGDYFLTVDKTFKGQQYSIRRYITLPDGTKIQPRYPRKKYKGIKTKEELDQLLNRLNYRKRNKNIEIRTSFISPHLMEAFENLLLTDIPNEKDARYLYQTVLKKYFLNFFIGTLKLYDPKEWTKHQAEWGAALLGKIDNKIFTKKPSAKLVKTTIQVANRFMSFLHVQMPEDYPPITFKPLSRGAIKTYQAQNTGKKIGQFIPDEDWKTIDSKLPSSIGCFIRLMYYYGLRRAESLGFSSTDSVRRDFLKITQQLKSYNEISPTYSILKDKEQRETPHWFLKPEIAYKLIQDGIDKKRHPDTLSVEWEEFIKGLGMTYKLHDFRRTFITKALRKYAPRDVQLAVGHANLLTTMKYAQDDRSLKDDIWKPAS